MSVMPLTLPSDFVQPATHRHPRQLFGYDVLDHAGDGAGSRIYVVSHPETSQLYALKHVVRKTEKDIRFIEQLETEYEIGQRVTHPALRRPIELKINRTLLRRVTDGALVLELFDGAPLDQILPTSIPEIISCFIATAQALAAMHQHGFVHCDLKPNNILRNSHGTVKVIDLGQACKIGTIKERIQGTPDYISPEQVKCKPITPSTDVYNFGATLYWALTGTNLPTLFTLKKGENSLLASDRLDPPHALNPKVPEPLSAFVMECVRTNPKKRPADMVEVERRLEVLHHVAVRAASINA